MAFGDSSAAGLARFGAGQTNPATDDRVLFLKVFGGEVLSAFTEKVFMRDKVMTKSVPSGKSFQFPKTWKATAEYHAAGQEMLGNDIDTTEVTITIDGKLVAHTAIYDLDQKMSHFDVTGEFSAELGRALGRVWDKNAQRAIIQAARAVADGPFPGGTVITDAALTNTGAIDGEAWIDAIRDANIALFNKDVPEDMPRYMVVNRTVFDALKYAKDANGRYLVLSRDLNGAAAGGVPGRGETLEIDGVTVMAARTLPNTNETADTTVYAKYRANYAKTTGILWIPNAVGVVELQGLNMETTRDIRRQEDFMVASMAFGAGTVRAEGAVEFAIP
jgi:hypothetical protein